MANMYAAVKFTHMLLAGCSVSLFLLRYIGLECGASWRQQTWLKVAPHLIDTLLLLVALMLLWQVPWYLQSWLWQKVALVLCYIVCGWQALKAQQSLVMRRSALIAALSCIAGIVYLAHYKTPLL